MNQKHAIVANYWVCFILGAFFLPFKSRISGHFQFDWLPWALILGFIFLLNFTLTGLTVRKLGLAVSSVSTKMSLVIPVVFSLVFHNAWSSVNPISILGLALAFVSIILVSGNKNESDQIKKSGTLLFLPVAIFLLSGLTDSLSQWCNEANVGEGEGFHFAWLVFGGAAFSSSLLILLQAFKGKSAWSLASVLGGITLGIPNYFSYLFMLKALDSYNHEGNFVFPIANLGVIVLTGLVSVFIFFDVLSRRQWIGLCLAALSLLLISSKAWA